MNWEIACHIATAVTAILSGIAICVSYFSWREAKKHNSWQKEVEKIRQQSGIDNQLTRILEFTIQYPYLESRHITENWEAEAIKARNNKDYVLSEEFMRYDQFCNLLFNFLEELYNFYKGDKEKIENYIDIKNWVRIHRQIWNTPLNENENIDGYQKEFRDFINSYIEK